MGFEEEWRFDEGLQAGLKQGVEQGIEQGYAAGQRELATTLLERRFGPLPAEIQQRIEAWPEGRIVELVEQTFQIGSLDELRLDDAGRT